MNRLPAHLRLLLVMLVMCGAVADAWGGVTTITLRSTVRVGGDEPITLGQVGDIEGDQGGVLAGVELESVLDEENGGWMTLTSEDLRSYLNDLEDINGGSIEIRGAGVSVRRIDRAYLAPTEPVIKDAVVDAAPDGVTVRKNIERWVHDRYRIGGDPVTIAFRDLDEDFLDTPSEGRLVEIREISKRGRTAIRVIVMDEYAIVAEQALVFDVTVQRSVLIARERLNRGTILERADFMSELRWVNPEDQPASAEDAVGMALAKTVNSGQLLEPAHIELPMVIRRGDLVSAKSIAGSVVVTVRGRAKSNARLGETVELESMNGETRFTARAVSKGRAMILKKPALGGGE